MGKMSAKNVDNLLALESIILFMAAMAVFVLLRDIQYTFFIFAALVIVGVVLCSILYARKTNRAEDEAVRCANCGTEYEGKFCPNCATPADDNDTLTERKKKRAKIGVITIACLTVAVIGAFGFVWTLGGANLATGGGIVQTDAEEKAYIMLDRAQELFDELDYGGMLDKCDELTAIFPETEAAKNVPSFIYEMNSSVMQETAKGIYTAYQENAVKADGIYEDKLVSVSGVVSSIGKDILDDVFLTLNNGETFSLMNPHFTFKDEAEIAKVAELKEGDALVIIGECTGASIGSPMFKDCYIIG